MDLDRNRAGYPSRAADAADAADEQNELAEALRGAPADAFPQIAALGPELLSGTGPDRLDWGFRVLISGGSPRPPAEGTPAARESATTGRPEPQAPRKRAS